MRCWYVALPFCVSWCCVVPRGFGSHCPLVCCVVGYRGSAWMVNCMGVGVVCLVAALFLFSAALIIVFVDNG